jgi:uncharacterized protein with von Willebrand factor type A (vWA) domain
MASEAQRRVSSRIARLAATMRAGRVRVGLGELLTAHAALAAVESADRAQAYHALRAALCSSREDYAVFDAAFTDVFGDLAGSPPLEAASTLPEREALWPDRRAPGDEREHEPPAAPAGWSDLERLRHADFGELDREDLARASALMATLARRGPTRRSRRLTRRARRRRCRGAIVDVRRTIRESMRVGGEPLRRRWRERSRRPRRLVVICDTSGSMRAYADGLLLYVQALVAARRGVEAFVFGTRLTRVTAELDGRDGRAALARLAGVVEDFGGGTRIGESLRALNCEHGGRLGRGATVIVLSDGWDRGATDELADELARLRRTAHRLVWLNPLKARPGYEPLAGGMAAALPHLDAFLAGNSVAGLEELAELLAAGLTERDGR